ncbi:MAG: PQQ-binding-like beta-propeller repeat protein [Planctomycetes bacterium]|nr:PQQ-binding-like beta-propeller repeat protein [Planctomycetota bacterium]
MRISTTTLSILLAAALWAPRTSAQEWSTQELRARSQGFLQPGIRAELTQIGELVARADACRSALALAIHGDHREYTLKIARYLDQLADPRWLAREDAERALIEIGGRGLAQIEARAVDGATLEERIRARRIAEAIELRGTDDEDNQTRILQGLTAAALYFDGSERLTDALRSALGHTDALVVENAFVALGHGGGEAVVPLLVDRVTRRDARGSERDAARIGLALSDTAAAHAAIRQLLDAEGGLARSEAVQLLWDLRAWPDTGELVAALASSAADPAVRALAGVELPAPRPLAERATLQLADRDEVQAELRGLSGSFVEAAGVVPNLPVARLRHSACPILEFPRETRPLAAADCRVFLKQGSLLVGRLRGADRDAVRFESPLFGEVALPRTSIQGLAVDPSVDRLVGAAASHDRIRLRDERMIDAHVLGIDGDGLHYVPADQPGAAELVVAIADVAGLLFERPTQGSTSDELYTRIDLTDGDRLLAHVGGVGGDGSYAVWIEGLGAARLPGDHVRRLEFAVGGGAVWGFTLIADYSDNRVVEVDEQGHEGFALDEIYGAWDAECLENGNLLITEFALNRVSEITRAGEEVWMYDDLKNPYDADALPNGNVLIADTFGERVIEVDRATREIVWSYTGVKPYDADRLPNGDTLIADSDGKRVIEVTPDGTIVWERGDLPGVHDADRLPNGNTLITLRTQQKVIEVDRTGKVVFEIDGLSSPSDADRLPNGNTLVAENGGVREFNRRGEVVWQVEAAWAVEVNRY